MTDESDRQGHQDEPGGQWLAWLASGIGLVLTVTGTGYILWDGVTRGDQPPSVQVEALRVVEGASGYTVEIKAVNPSGMTAATVMIEGRLKRNGKSVEKSETTFDYVPGGSERRGGLYFSRDPRRLELELRPHGYIEP